MHLTFFVVNQQKPQEGVVRPFLNFARALDGKYEVSFSLLNCSRDFYEYFERNGFQVTTSKTKNGLIEELRSLKPNLLFTDDDLERLKLVEKVKKNLKLKSICYVQVLYGSHAVANCFDIGLLVPKQKLVFTAIKYAPFSLLSQRYSKLLRDFDMVIANSKITATFLLCLYNVEIQGIVYPPIDTTIFQPTSKKTKKEITLYLGSHLGDTKRDFVHKIVENVKTDGYFINLFGNAKVATEIMKKDSAFSSYYSNIDDSDLAQMYSRSKLTVCPQKWEQFGQVPVESMACGTPVLAFNCMGFQETINASTGWLANNEAEFLQLLHQAFKGQELPSHELREHVLKNFSIDNSGKALEELIDRYS